MSTAVEQAVRNFGNQDAMAAALGVSQPTVSEWVRDERPVPPKRCVQIEEHPTNRASETPVVRWDLRPLDWWELWPDLRKAKGAPKPAPEKAEA